MPLFRPSYRPTRNIGVIPIDNVGLDPLHLRQTEADAELVALAESLKTHGQISPIRVRWNREAGKWLVVSGARRFAAAKLAGLETILCHFLPDETSVQAERLIENLLREDMRPLEEAAGFAALMDSQGWTAREVAARLSISEAKVSRALALLKLDKDVQAEIDSGAIPARTGYAIARIQDEQKRQEAIQRAKAPVRKRREKTKTTTKTYRLANGGKVRLEFPRKTTAAEIAAALRQLADSIEQASQKAAA